MKHNALLIMAAALMLMCCGCSEQLLNVDDALTSAESVRANWQDSIASYTERARLGDGDAYLRLAYCYHEGKGVEKNFYMSYAMAQMAEQYGGITKRDDFFHSLPDVDPDRLLVEALDDVDHVRSDEALQKAELLAAQDHPEADLVRGVVALDNSRKDEAIALFHQAADKGSPLARLALGIIDESRRAIIEFAEQYPTLYCVFARDVIDTDDNDYRDENTVAAYYRKAYDHLCLDRYGVSWLLDYYERQSSIGNPVADSLDIERLRTMQSRLVPRD